MSRWFPLLFLISHPSQCLPLPQPASTVPASCLPRSLNLPFTPPSPPPIPCHHQAAHASPCKYPYLSLPLTSPVNHSAKHTADTSVSLPISYLFCNLSISLPFSIPTLLPSTYLYLHCSVITYQLIPLLAYPPDPCSLLSVSHNLHPIMQKEIVCISQPGNTSSVSFSLLDQQRNRCDK